MTIPTLERLNTSMRSLDRPLLYWTMTLALVFAAASTVLAILDINPTWSLAYDRATGLKSSLSAPPVIWGYVDAGKVAPDLKGRLPAGVTPDWRLPVSITADRSTLASKALARLSSVPMQLLALSVVWILRRMVISAIGRDLTDLRPFVTENVRRIQIIASMVLFSPAVDFLSTVAQWELVSRSLANDISVPTYDASLWPLQFGGGMLLFILAAVFEAGVRLREDVEGLV